jgi:signal transduction histidine kinase
MTLSRWRWLFALVWICLAAAGSIAERKIDVLTLTAEPRIALWQTLETLPDAEGKLSPDAAAQAFNEGRGQRLPNANHSYGKWLAYPYWARFSVRNDSNQPQTWLLTYESPTQDSVKLWQAFPESIWHTIPVLDEHHTGFVTGQLFPVWRLKMMPYETQTFMLRLDGYNMMRFPLFVMQDDAFMSQQRNLFGALCFILAIPLVVVLYVLTLIPLTEDKSLPLFVGMAVAEMLGASWISGALHAAFPFIDRWMSGWLGWSGYVLLLGVSCVHARVFMNTRATDVFADALLRVSAFIWFGISPLLALFKPDAARLYLLIGGTVHAVILMWLSLRGFARIPQGVSRLYMRLFVAVWMIYAASGVLWVVYRVLQLPIYITLMSSFVQGAIVASLLGCAVSVQVIRQRRQLLLSMQRTIDRNHLYASAHHDLWQPIQSVRLLTTALSTASDDQKTLLLKDIESAVTSAQDFMESLKESEAPACIQLVVLHDLLAPLVEEYRHVANRKHIGLRYYAKNMLIRTDPVLLQRIVRNLLSNAIRYTNKGGRVVLGFRHYQGQPWLMVYDNGIGMSTEQATHCFDIFSRVGDVSRVPEGMGLYSVKRAANQLNTETRLVSQLDRGTAIGISLRDNSQK